MKEFKNVKPNAAGQRQLQVLQAVQARTNRWNNPERVELKPGDILTAVCTTASERGDFFFKVNESKVEVSVMPPAYQSRYPYDVGAFNPEFLAEV